MPMPVTSEPVPRAGMLPALPSARESTRLAWHQAVERAVDVMRGSIADPLTLDALARSALLSPYHFHRVFRLVTGIPPGRYLTALRMAEAKRLLLCTSQRVTDVCFAVGFESLGTFTTRFGQLVGVAPQELRRLAELHGGRSLTSLAGAGTYRRGSDSCLSGWLDGPDDAGCFAVVGLFERAVAQGFPVACAMVAETPGGFRVDHVAPGTYCPLAVGFPQAPTVLDAILLEPQQLLVGTSPQPISLLHGQPGANVRLRMGRPAAVDPPIVFAAPLIAAQASGRTARTP